MSSLNKKKKDENEKRFTLLKSLTFEAKRRQKYGRKNYEWLDIPTYKEILNEINPEDIGSEADILSYKRAIETAKKNTIKCENITFGDIQTPYKICYNPITKKVANYEYNYGDYVLNDKIIGSVIALDNAVFNTISKLNRETEDRKRYLEARKNEIYEAIEIASQTGLDELIDEGLDRLNKVNEELENLDLHEKEQIQKVLNNITYVEEIGLFTLYRDVIKKHNPNINLDTFLDYEKKYTKNQYDKECREINDKNEVECTVLEGKLKAIDKLKKDYSVWEHKPNISILKYSL